MEKLKCEMEKIKGVEVFVNEKLSQHTSFKIGGEAKYVCVINDEKGLKKLLKILSKNNTNYYVIGNGTNLLVSDHGYNGVIIKLGGSFKKYKVKGKKIICESGLGLLSLNNICKQKGLAGLEFSYGIPGSVGGAVRMNAGAYGKDVSSVIKYVKAFNGTKIVKIKNKNLGFGYRKSVFVDNGNWVILKVCVKLKKGDKFEIEKNQQEIITKRLNSQPYDKPSAGSVFKRNDKYIISKVIDELGLKGYKIGGAEVSTKHAGFIINSGDATCKDVINLVKYIQEKVFSSYGFVPQLEVELMGDFDDFTW